jgi:hypothetical protein
VIFPLRSAHGTGPHFIAMVVDELPSHDIPFGDADGAEKMGNF